MRKISSYSYSPFFSESRQARLGSWTLSSRWSTTRKFVVTRVLQSFLGDPFDSIVRSFQHRNDDAVEHGQQFLWRDEMHVFAGQRVGAVAGVEPLLLCAGKEFVLVLLLESEPAFHARACDQGVLDDIPHQRQAGFVVSGLQRPDLVLARCAGACAAHRQEETVAVGAGYAVDHHADVNVLRFEAVEPGVQELVSPLEGGFVYCAGRLLMVVLVVLLLWLILLGILF